MAINRSMLDGIGASRANTKSDYFKDGQGLALLKEVIYKDMNDGPTFVARFTILESSSKGDVDPVTKQPVVPNAPGSEVGWIQKTGKQKSAAGNVKSFVLALLGYSEAEVDSKPGSFADAVAQLADLDSNGQDARGAIASKGGVIQPGRGMVVRYATTQAAIRSGPNAGKVLTFVKFSHVGDLNTKELIAKRRAELDAAEPLR